MKDEQNESEISDSDLSYYDHGDETFNDTDVQQVQNESEIIDSDLSDHDHGDETFNDTDVLQVQNILENRISDSGDGKVSLNDDGSVDISDEENELNNFNEKITVLFNLSKHKFKNFFNKDNEYLFKVAYECLRFNGKCKNQNIEEFVDHVKIELTNNCLHYQKQMDDGAYDEFLGSFDVTSLGKFSHIKWSSDCVLMFLRH